MALGQRYREGLGHEPVAPIADLVTDTPGGRAGSTRHGRGLAAALAALFFASGALALVYEVLWQRRFALVFGAAAPATVAVLAAYFAGLGAGSLALGGAARRWSRPLRAYAALEALIGLGALLVLPVSAVLERAQPWLFERLAPHAGVLLAGKTALVFVSLALPTFCMGGTLPVLAQLVDRGERKLGVTAGRLYVANTAGAALGALCVPFALLPAFGASGSLQLCVAGNLLVAVVAWSLDRRWSIQDTVTPVVAAARPSSATEASGARSLLAYALVSGLVTFVLQVLWNRAFAQVHENSVYSFALIVAVFILALAIGAQAARLGLGRGVAPEKLLGGAWVAGGALLALSPWLFLRMTDGLSYVGSDAGWGQYAQQLALLTLAVVFPPVALIGIGFPAIMERAGRSSRASVGSLLGGLLAANVAGCVAGALLAGFLLPKTLGLWRSLALTALVVAAAGAWTLGPRAPGAPRRRFFLALALGFGAALWLPSALDWPRVRVVESRGERLLALAEGSYGIVAVVEDAGSRRLKLNNYYVLGGTLAAGDERMGAHVPLLLHPSPRKVAMIGLGTGISASGALFHPIDGLTAVELVPEVVDAARAHFREANAAVLEDPRTRVVVDDARSYLRSASERFDVIVGDLVVPWRPGEGDLLTLEHFGAARRRLAPGGLFCQWLPLFQLSEPELRILLRTFTSVFPRVQLWRGDFSADQPALALVGGLEARDLDPAVVRRRLGEMRPDPLNLHLAEPAAFWMYFVGILGSEDVGATRVNSEDHPWLELIGPRQHAGGSQGPIVAGRRLQAWLSEVRRLSGARLAGLGATEAAGIEAGLLLQDYSLALSQGDEEAARSAQVRLGRLLPRRAFDAIFPGAGDATSR